jgi:putative ABC transport system ATP-binding protein
MIFQSYNLIPTLTVLDNVILPQIFQRVNSKKRKETGRALLKKLDLGALEERLPQELSGGQQQRVSIARALVNNPPVILADEAVGNLDSQSAKNVLDIISILNEEDGKTIISVTHNPEHLFYADRIFYIKDGMILKVETNQHKIKVSSKADYPAEALDRRRTPLDLLLQAYPDLSSMQIHTMLAPFKAKMLVGYLMSQFESQEIDNLEKIITDRLLKRISAEDLLHNLDESTEKNGLGLNKNIALRFSKVVEEVLEKSEFLEEGYKKIAKGETDPILKMVDQIRHSLLDTHHGELNLSQLEALNRGIEYRILNKLTRFELQEYLDRSLGKGGVGLNRKTAKNFSRKVELLMLLEYGK